MCVLLEQPAKVILTIMQASGHFNDARIGKLLMLAKRGGVCSTARSGWYHPLVNRIPLLAECQAQNGGKGCALLE